MNDPSRVLVAIRVRVSRAPAFKAFTGQIDKWWRPNSLFTFFQNKIGTMAFERACWLIDRAIRRRNRMGW